MNKTEVIWVSFINIYVYRILVYACRPQDKEKASHFISDVRTLAAPSLGSIGDRAARWSASLAFDRQLRDGVLPHRA